MQDCTQHHNGCANQAHLYVPVNLISSYRPLLLTVAFGTLSFTLAGCGIGTTTKTVVPENAPVTGSVFGGQQPIVGSVVSLFAAGTTGYGSAPTLLSTTVSGVGGNYSLPLHAPCATPDSLVYVQATGGDSGTGANTAINLVSIVGNCSAATSTTRINVNELTTVAAAYVLAPFASVAPLGTGIGTSATNILGLNNAAGPAQKLVSSATGLVNVTDINAGVVLPSTLVNTLADILASCVNTSGPTSTTCASLFTATTVNGFAPIDTFQAALNIALHPGSNVPALFALVGSTPPFQPTVATANAPNDFSVAIGYNGGGIGARGVNAVAIDASGNAWVTSYYTNSAGTVSGLIEVTPTGTFPGGPTGFANGVVGPMNNLAIDQTGNIWVADETSNPSLTALTPTGAEFTNIPNATNPNGVAIDSTGDVWYSLGGNNFNTFSEVVDLAGAYASGGTNYTAASHFGVDVCITPGYIYDVSIGAPGEPSTLTQLNLGTGIITSVAPDGGAAGLSGCAVDNAANLYLANFQQNTIEVYSSSLALTNTYPITAPVYGQELALDGLGNIFVPTYVPQGSASYNSFTQNPASLVEFSSTGTLVSPAAGYFPVTGDTPSGATNFDGLTSQHIAPGGVAIDGSGNVWLTGNDGQSVPSLGNMNTGNLPAYVTEVLGVAAPVVTPKSVALSTSTIAMRP